MRAIRVAAFSALALALAAARPALAAPSGIAVYPDVVRPEQHPRFLTVQTQPLTWPVLGNTTRFATLRGFSQTPNNTIVDYQSTLAQYAELGDVIWPVYMTLFAPNLQEVAAYMAQEGFYMTDLWG
jgi:hypothetical protein